MPSNSRRVAPIVALTILRVIRSQDRPEEYMQDDDPQVTLPRRLGLSTVVRQQIGRYEEAVRRGRRIGSDEIRDLIGLVTRRPDTDEVFLRVGEQLSEVGRGRGRVRAMTPAAVRRRLGKRRVHRQLDMLFGGRIGRFQKGQLRLAGRDRLLVDADPGGEACGIVSGLMKAVLERYMDGPVLVRHEACLARGDSECTWTVLDQDATIEELVTGVDGVGMPLSVPTNLERPRDEAMGEAT